MGSITSLVGRVAPLLLTAPSGSNVEHKVPLFLFEQQAQCGLDLRHVTVVELVGTYPAQIGRIRHTRLPPGLALQLRYY